MLVSGDVEKANFGARQRAKRPVQGIVAEVMSGASAEAGGSAEDELDQLSFAPEGGLSEERTIGLNESGLGHAGGVGGVADEIPPEKFRRELGSSGRNAEHEQPSRRSSLAFGQERFHPRERDRQDSEREPGVFGEIARRVVLNVEERSESGDQQVDGGGLHWGLFWNHLVGNFAFRRVTMRSRT